MKGASHELPVDIGGESVEVTGRAPVELAAASAWIVQSGRVDVFSVSSGSVAPEGSRLHLCRVHTGELIFGIRRSATSRFVGVGAPGTAVRECPLARLEWLCETEEYQRWVVRAVETWVSHLYGGIALRGEKPPHKPLHYGESIQLPSEGNVSTASGVGWLRVERGRVLLLGHEAATVPEGATVPLTRLAWARASAGTAISFLPSAELLKEGRAGSALWQGIEDLHDVVLTFTEERLRRSQQTGLERGEAQEQRSRSTMRAALWRLASTMERGTRRSVAPPGEPMQGTTDDRSSILAAFRMVVGPRGIGVPTEYSAPAALARARNPIHALADAYGVRLRRITLSGKWWQEDCGPLLARLADSPRAVAVLSANGRGYEFVDPVARTSTRVDETSVTRLHRTAYKLYVPLARDRIGPLDLVRFGMASTGRDLATVGFAAAVTAVLGLVPPIAVGTLFNTIIPGAERGLLLQLTLLLTFCALVVAALGIVRGVALLRIQTRMAERLQSGVMDRLLTLPLPFFRQFSAGELAERAMAIEKMRSVLSGSLLSLLLGGALSMAQIALLFRYGSLGIALTAVGLIAFAAATTIAVSYFQLRSQRVLVELRAKSSGLVLQLLTGISKLKVIGAEVRGFDLWARLFSRQREEQYRLRVRGNVLAMFTTGFPIVGTIIVFALVAKAHGAPQGAAGEGMSTGDFVAFLTAFNLAMAAVVANGSAIVDALVVVPLYEQVKPILTTKPEVRTEGKDPGPMAGRLALQHVTFRYGADLPPALDGVTIRAEAGEFVALVGPSGSGKSTALGLLLGFERPEAGSVLFDDQDLELLDRGAVRRQMGVVIQNAKITAGSIFSTIVGSSSATLDEAWEAARMAGLDRDISDMPMGMYTVVNSGATSFSGGQRQRLLIARALVRRPRVVLFDEATSALDNRTQEIVTHSLQQMEVTRVVVAHRLSTIRRADRIYVMNEGRVVEVGTYNELIDSNGVFSDLAARQLA